MVGVLEGVQDRRAKAAGTGRRGPPAVSSRGRLERPATTGTGRPQIFQYAREIANRGATVLALLHADRGENTDAMDTGPPDGECRPGVQQDGRLRGTESAPLAVSAGRATTHETAQVHLGSALRDGLVSVDGHSALSDASRTQKIIVKP